MSIRLRWLTNSCYEIQSDGIVIVTDPCIRWTAWQGFTVEDFAEGIDYVAISHLHWDHITELKEIENRFHPYYFTGAMGFPHFCEYLNPNTSRTYPMYPDQHLAMEGFSIKCLYNRHWNSNKIFKEQLAGCMAHLQLYKLLPGLEKLQKIGCMDMNSYLFIFNNGCKVLFWGGDVTISQQSLLKDMHPDIMIAQFSIKNMEDRAAFFSAIAPDVLLFHHQDFQDSIDEYEPKIKTFAKIYHGKLISPKHGEWIEF